MREESHMAVKLTGADGRVIARSVRLEEARATAARVNAETGETLEITFDDPDVPTEILFAETGETLVDDGEAEGVAPKRASRRKAK